MSSLDANGDCVCGLVLLFGCFGFPNVLLVAIQYLLCRSSSSILLLRSPLWPHHIVPGGGHWYSSATHPTFVPWLLWPRVNIMSWLAAHSYTVKSTH